MLKQIDRRTFLKTGALLSAGAFWGNWLPVFSSRKLDSLLNDKLNLSVVQGDDYYANTFKAVDLIGGMKNIVRKGAVVGLLVNSRYRKPGTYVKPEITLAIINMCYAAGAREIISLENVSDTYWQLSSVSRKYTDVIGRIKNAGENFAKVRIPKGVALKEAEVEKAFLSCDVFINVAIFKQHAGIKITGCLKNLMGITSSETNRYFHYGSNSEGGYSDVPFLSQCIADINLIRKPDLCIGDATEYITSNGPFGPGRVVKSRKIAAGKDIVAIDSWGAKVLGYTPEDILQIKMAGKNGIGEMDLKKIQIKEIQV